MKLYGEFAPMPKMLRFEPKRRKPPSPPTTTQFAKRLLAASNVISQKLPRLQDDAPRYILFSLLVAEDDGEVIHYDTMPLPPRTSRALANRWIAVLLEEGLVELKYGLLNLTEHGYMKVVTTLEELYSVQRNLD